MRTKIVATIGPKSDDPEILEKLVESGLDIARINFSHCTESEFRSRKKLLRKFSKKHGREVKILQDLQGPRIRVGKLAPEGWELKRGEIVVFSTVPNGQGTIFIDHPELHKDIKKGHPIYLVNGEMELTVTAIRGTKIYAEVVRGGTLYSRKAVNVPHTKLRISGLTKKDIKDLKFALKEGIDYIAISFVQSAKDIEKARKIIKGKAKIIAKIETALALQNIDEIIRVSDGIMIARGDLGIEVPVERLPFIQINLIRQAIWHGKPSIMATQVLTSMVKSAHPTRAEVSDIATTVYEGADAIMLSDETASGDHPVRAIQTLARVIRQAEEYYMNRANML